MKEKQLKFLELAKYYEQLKEKLDEVRTEMAPLMSEIGVGTLFQDEETLTVYKIVKPTGTFTHYRDVDYVRTAQGEERSGGLSKKQAGEAGFSLVKS